jgi:hypothetical protein
VQAHDEFLSSLPSKPEIDPLRIKCWHHDFDLTKVVDMPLADLPEDPVKSRAKSFAEILASSRSGSIKPMIHNVMSGVAEANRDPAMETPKKYPTPSRLRKSVLTGSVL